VASARGCASTLQASGMPWAALYDSNVGDEPVLFGASPPMPEVHTRLGSVSKLVVALIYARLVNDGQLDRASPVTNWLGDVDGLDNLTLADLDTHRSGLGDALNSFWFRRRINRDVTAPVPLDDVIAASLGISRSAALPLYANINAILIARICEIATGRPFSALVAALATPDFDLRYDPLGALPTPAAEGWRMGRGPGRIEYGDKLHEATHYNPSWGGPAGGMTCRISDMARFGDRILEPLRALLPTQASGFYMLARVQDGWLHHAGDVPGFSAWAGYDAKDGRSVVSCAGLSWHPDVGNPAETLALSQITVGGPLRWS
ncbi:MAG: serine hydrolase, partial [Pseudomonadota bacterium]